MPLHPQAQALLVLAESLGDPPIETITPEAARATRAARRVPSDQEVYEVRDVDAGGVPARLYRPDDSTGLGLLVYFHGGGWVLGDLDSHDDLVRRLVAASGHAVLSVDYRLAPEHPFPAGIEDAATAVRWAAANAAALGCDPELIAVGGDSAGANLAVVVAQNEPVSLRLQLLFYPAVDARGTSASVEEFREGPFLTAAGMQWFIDHYLAGDDGSLEDPRVSPLLADDAAVSRGPAALVIVPELDPLRDEGESYAARLAALGVPTTLSRYDGMFHGFVSFGAYLDDARAAIEQAGAALAAAFRAA